MTLVAARAKCVACQRNRLVTREDVRVLRMVGLWLGVSLILAIGFTAGFTVGMVIVSEPY
ncbi:hypothetical protein AB0C51_10520 [Streptomyces pathocidini]|uniref:hypothetical protein n=1 Tax=Streptomyces pathocidini TaxID=1650571 RepID=UPI0033EA728E